MRSTLLVLLSTCGAVSSASTCEMDANSLLQSRQSVLHRHAGGTDASALLTSMRNTAKSLQKGSLVTMDPADVNAALATANTALQTMFPLIAQQHAFAQSEIEHGIAAVQACHNQHGGEVGAHIAQMVTTEFARKAQCEEALGNEIQEEQDTCAGMGDNPNCLCDEARAAIEARTELCDAVTDAYEGAFCENQLTCNMLYQCHGDELGVYNALMADIHAAMISRQQEYITFMQVECLMDLITNAMLTGTPIDAASLTGCDDVSVDHLTLTFPEPPPAPTACPAQSGDPQCGDVVTIQPVCECQVIGAQHHLPSSGHRVGTLETTTTMNEWVPVMGGISSLDVSKLSGPGNCVVRVQIGGAEHAHTYSEGEHPYPMPTGNDNIESVKLECQ